MVKNEKIVQIHERFMTCSYYVHKWLVL